MKTVFSWMFQHRKAKITILNHVNGTCQKAYENMRFFGVSNMVPDYKLLTFGVCAILLGLAANLAAEQRFESFDKDPGWDGHNNRSAALEQRPITQDFGYSETSHCGDGPEAGGMITPDGSVAFYAKKIPEQDLSVPCQASGKLVVSKGSGNALLGFFNDKTINEWRTPNSLVFRINSRGQTDDGREVFHAHIEYATDRWRAGAGIIGRYDQAADRMDPDELSCEQVHTWSIQYDPKGAKGLGLITATFDEVTVECPLSPGHKKDGMTFNRFGLLNVIKSVDTGNSLWVDDVTINGKTEDFTQDPQWEGIGNRQKYLSSSVRPRFDYGFSPTQHAGGKQAGEFGGLFYRGDCRYPERLGYCGGRLEPLTLARPLRASGKLVFMRGVTDSTTSIGFFHSEHSVTVNPSQSSTIPMDFLGFHIEGPSREGFYMYPVYRVHGLSHNAGLGVGGYELRIYPDSTTPDWTLEYDPNAAGGNGQIRLSLDGQTQTLDLRDTDKPTGAFFDRFGAVSSWIDGNGQVVYLDDLKYTCR